MTPFEVATEFYHTCESLKGPEGCAPYLADGATFQAQCEPVAEMTTAAEYAGWFQAVGQGPLSGCEYTLHSASWDESSRTASFFGSIKATHSSEGGPVPPTGKSTNSQYVYLVTMNDENKVQHLVKVWNAPWALRELGWM